MTDEARTLYLNTDEDFEGPLTPTEAQERIEDGVRAGKDLDDWQLYEKLPYNTTVVVDFSPAKTVAKKKK